MKPIKRISAKGVISYRIFVKNKNTGKKESKVFSNRQYAIDWANKRQAEIERQSIYGAKDETTIRSAVQGYLEKFGANSGRAKNFEIGRLLDFDIADIKVADLKPQDLIQHCIWRNQTVKPQSAKKDVIWLKKVLETMSVVNNFDFDSGIFAKANVTLKSERLIAPPGKRTRIATWKEMLTLTRYFVELDSSLPMVDIMWFAAYSSRRLAEITRLQWEDNDYDNQTGLVTDVKHPTLKKGNSKRFKYQKSAWKIMLKQPKKNSFIFPYNPVTISDYFIDAVRACKIKDLHFHDLRRNAITKLFRDGYSIEQVMLFSLHSSLSSLQVYMALKAGDIPNR